MNLGVPRESPALHSAETVSCHSPSGACLGEFLIPTMPFGTSFSSVSESLRLGVGEEFSSKILIVCADACSDGRVPGRYSIGF
ncbi:unnamed protein product [Zymoseptoria tritici ST99CH_1A5]|uniref:Uncharacterized protein n=1 Tax=Zymoseptoria tritici ST99CH_1A5 TaxID=1276529 RepID=A0A1Y6L5E9_ZYMTR|nr:unnamed protein product [Zymoseptoria tritici ST99CH_1A5]